MEERQVTVDAVTHPLGTPFMVIATQNPIEHEGTYPLPEAQLDRFMLRLSIGYPSPEIEAEILGTHGIGAPLDDIGPVTDAPGVAEMIVQAREVHVGPDAPPVHRRPRRGDAAPLGHLPGCQPARLDRAAAGGARDGRGRGARLRDPRRRQGARGAGPRPPGDRDGRRRHERPGARRDPHRAARRGAGPRLRDPTDALGPRARRLRGGPGHVARRAAARLARARGRGRSGSPSCPSRPRCSPGGGGSGSPSRGASPTSG